jgi:hypothetical protein
MVPLPLLPAFVVVHLCDGHATRVRWNHNVVLICMSSMIKNDEDFFHPFIHLYTCTSSFEKRAVNLVSHLLIGLLFWHFTFLSILYVLHINLLSDD